MKTLVTGGGGFLGRYIVEKLAARGDSVRVLGRSPYPPLQSVGVETVQADIRNRNAVVNACRDVDVVFHVASIVKLWGAWEEFRGINVDGTTNVIEGCKAHGVPRLVYTSTPSVVFGRGDLCNIDETYPYPERYDSFYPASKAMAERAVLSANGGNGLSTVVLRPHLIWGPRDTHLVPAVILRARKHQLMIVGDGRAIVDFTYVENAADAHLLAGDLLSAGSTVAGRAYFISQDEPVLLWEFVNLILERMHIRRATRKIPLPVARAVGATLEIVHSALHLEAEPRVTRFLAIQLARSHYFNISRAKQDLGYTPRVPTAQGLDRLIEYMEQTPPSSHRGVQIH